MRVPRIAGLTGKPFVPHRQRTQRKFGYEDRSGSIEALHHGGVFIEALMLESARAPGGGITLDREQIFCAPRDAMQRPAMFAGSDFSVGGFGVREGSLFRERNY